MVNWSSVFQLFEQVQIVGSMHSVILGVVNNVGNVKISMYTLPRQKYWNDSGISFQNLFTFLDANSF